MICKKNHAKLSYFAIFQQLKPSYFAIIANLNFTKINQNVKFSVKNIN